MRTEDQIQTVIAAAIVKYALDASEERRPSNSPPETVGRLSVKTYIGRTRWSGYYLCECSCGELTVVAGMNLMRSPRQTESCGCIRTERATAVNRVRLKTHGMRFTRTYRCWANMKNRGINLNGENAKHYIGRGIDICPHLRVFENFVADFGECPSKKHSIDRWPNNESGGYWCGHCEDCISKGRPLNIRWGTEKQQARGKRDNHLMTYKGETMCIADMAEKYGIAYGTLQARVTALGWSDEAAIETPVKSRYKKRAATEGQQEGESPCLQ
jgi:hypothetical protein